MTEPVYYTNALENFDSSNLGAVYYDKIESRLYVCFLSGSIIGYRNVPEEVFQRIATAPSKGSAYNSLVRGKYTGLGENFYYEDFEKRPEISAGLDAVSQRPQKYSITAITKITRTVVAPTLEAAVETFQRENPGSTVTEVTISFV